MKDKKRLDLVEMVCSEIIRECDHKGSLSVAKKAVVDHSASKNTVLGTEIDIFSTANYVSGAMTWFHYYPENRLLTISVVSYPQTNLRIELYIRRRGFDKNLKPDVLHDEILEKMNSSKIFLEIEQTYTFHWDEQEWTFILEPGEKLLMRETDNPVRVLVHIILEKFLGQ